MRGVVRRERAGVWTDPIAGTDLGVRWPGCTTARYAAEVLQLKPADYTVWHHTDGPRIRFVLSAGGSTVVDLSQMHKALAVAKLKIVEDTVKTILTRDRSGAHDSAPIAAGTCSVCHAPYTKPTAFSSEPNICQYCEWRSVRLPVGYGGETGPGIAHMEPPVEPEHHGAWSTATWEDP